MSQKTFKGFMRDMYRENCKERTSWMQEPQALTKYYRQNRTWLREEYRKKWLRDA